MREDFKQCQSQPGLKCKSTPKESSRQWELETLSQGEWRPPSASPVCSLRTLVSCLRPGHQMIQRDLRDPVQPLGYFLLLFMHMGTGGTVSGDIKNIKLCYSSGCESGGHNHPHCFSQSRWLKRTAWLRANGYWRSISGYTAGVTQRFGVYITLSLLRIEDC